MYELLSMAKECTYVHDPGDGGGGGGQAGMVGVAGGSTAGDGP